MCQTSIRLDYSFYSNFCKVCKKTDKKKQRKENETVVACTSRLAEEISFKFDMWAATPGRQLLSQCKGRSIQIKDHGVKIMFSFFLSIQSWCGMPASLAAQYHVS